MVSHLKANLFWIIGTLSLFLGARIAGTVESSTLGMTPFRYYSALIIAFVLILVGGLLWISVAGAIREEI
ncbi:MAG: hypothetical protein ACLFS3_00995 [Candidatus Aenigmatarchaeota archaeon]